MNKNYNPTVPEETTIIVGNPNLFLLGVGIFGILLSATISYYTFDYKHFTTYNSNNIFVWVFAVLIAAYALLNTYLILILKKITLTNFGFSISYPFLFSSRDIDFNDVRKVYDQDYDIKGSHNYKLYDIYKGKKTVIELYESRNIIITSLEITNYNILAQNLKNITKSYFKIKTDYANIPNTQRYGWFIFWVFFIYFLIFYIVRKKYLSV